jgi:hypothetical protein
MNGLAPELLRRRLTTRVLVGALAIHLIIMVVVFVLSARLGAGDFDRFWEIGTTPGRPYVDFPVERAPAEVVMLRAIAIGAGTRANFGRGIVLVNIAADAAVVSALAWGWGLDAAMYFAVAAIPLLDLVLGRIDLWSVAAATVAVAAWKRDRRVITSVCLACGVALKLWPLPFSVLLAVAGTLKKRLAGIMTFALIGIGLSALWWALGGWSGFYQVLTFRGARGWQIESVVGSVLMLGGSKSRLEAGAFRTGSTNGLISVLMFIVAAPVSMWSVWRGARSGHLGSGWLASVGTLLLLSALFSAQFIAWLVPGAAIAWAEGDKRPAMLTAVAYTMTFLFMRVYVPVINGTGPAVMIVVMRNMIVAALVVDAISILIDARVATNS